MYVIRSFDQTDRLAKGVNGKFFDRQISWTIDLRDKKATLIFRQPLISTSKFFFPAVVAALVRERNREKHGIACVEQARRFISRAQG